MDEHGKYCPIMVAGGNTHVNQCIGKDCAWWLPYANDCALPVVGDTQICSNCGEEHEWDAYRASFCDTCGAKMDGGEE